MFNPNNLAGSQAASRQYAYGGAPAGVPAYNPPQQSAPLQSPYVRQGSTAGYNAAAGYTAPAAGYAAAPAAGYAAGVSPAAAAASYLGLGQQASGYQPEAKGYEGKGQQASNFAVGTEGYNPNVGRSPSTAAAYDTGFGAGFGAGEAFDSAAGFQSRAFNPQFVTPGRSGSPGRSRSRSRSRSASNLLLEQMRIPGFGNLVNGPNRTQTRIGYDGIFYLDDPLRSVYWSVRSIGNMSALTKIPTWTPLAMSQAANSIRYMDSRGRPVSIVNAVARAMAKLDIPIALTGPISTALNDYLISNGRVYEDSGDERLFHQEVYRRLNIIRRSFPDTPELQELARALMSRPPQRTRWEIVPTFVGV